LVAGYNMIPNGDTLVDISGNGYDGTVVDAVSAHNGLETFDSGVTNIDLGTLTDLYTAPGLSKHCTICFRVIPKSTQVSYLLGYESASTRYMYLTAGTSFGVRVSAGGSSTVSAPYTPNKPITLTFVRYGGTLFSLYANGVKVTGTLASDGDIQIRYIGNRLGDGSDMVFEDAKIFNYAFSEQEAKLYHSEWERVVKRGNFSDHPVGSTIG